MKKIFLLLFICILNVLNINAEIYEGSCGTNVKYSLDTNTGVLSITGTGEMSNFSSTGDAPWYAQKENIKSVIIADGVISIGSYSFFFCSNLISVTIPNRVTSIGSNAFYGCTDLISITIPNSVTGIGECAFEWCSNLTSIVVESGNTKYDSRDNCNAIIETATNTLILGCQNTVIPNSVTSIGEYAFFRCSGINSFEIPNSVKSIGKSAFQECSDLTSITIPNSVKSIGSYAFYGCRGLRSLTIPNSVTSMGSGVFSGCSGLKSVTIPNSVTSIGSSAFSDCSGLTSITIPNSVTSIGDYAFYCSGLTEVTIPNSVTTLGVHAFTHCSGLTSVTIPNSVTTIKYAAFYCSGLTSVTISENVKSIEDCVFSGCNRLTSIVVENGNSKYDSRDNCNAIIETVTNTLIAGCKHTNIPNDVTSIGSCAFSDNSSFSSITIPNSVTSIGYAAFYGCRGLTEVYCNAENVPNIDADNTFYAVDLNNATLHVPSSSLPAYKTTSPWSGFGTIKAIEEDANIISGSCGENVNYTLNLETGALSITGTGAMADYSSEEEVPWYEQRENIKSVEIADGVTTIGDRAFTWCYHLTSFDIPNSVTAIGNHAFERCDNLASLTIGNSVTSIGDHAFEQCSFTSIIIPSSAISMGENVFEYCTQLASIVVADGNAKYDSRDNCNAIIETATNTLVVGCKNTIIPNSVTSIGDAAFSTCTELTSIEIPGSVTSIGNGAFERCHSLGSITIPNSVTSIEAWAFYNCYSLTSINIPNSVTSIGACAFNRSGLTSVEIPTSVTSIEERVFEDCSGLTSINIPNSVTSIGYAVFNRSGLTSVTIPNSVTLIRELAFSNCSNLTEVYCYAENVPNTSTDAFENVDISNATLYVPAGSVNAYKTTSPWSGFGTIVALEPNIKCAKPTISFVNGKLEFSCETEDVRFIAKVASPDMGDYEGSSIPLTSTYIVSVYAKKEGYQDSDVATQEIEVGSGVAGKKGDVNLDGIVNGTDIQEVINIIVRLE